MRLPHWLGMTGICLQAPATLAWNVFFLSGSSRHDGGISMQSSVKMCKSPRVAGFVNMCGIFHVMVVLL